MVKLQVALDLLDLKKAVEIARQVEEFVEFIEAGTPLIKKVGMESVRELKESFQSKVIVADMKTMDTGYLEVEMAATAGADVVSVLAAAPNSTIISAVDAKKDYGVEIMADLIGVKDKIERLRFLERIGVDYVLVHTGIDEQKKGLSPFSDVREVSEKTNLKVAVAGGINDKNVKNLKGLGIDVVIVGGFITKSENPTVAAKKMRDALTWLK
ncbi:MAG: orotidine 5'-phosphate decarboxylase [Candidatus Aenigmarchaeota archaeon]|nr:orotidine 5'-phosphate decarboxylase [Candidatus Aenigmarchaeota archaeon]